MAKRRRLDEELISQGFFSTADEALRAVMAGEVSGGGVRFSSAAALVEPGCELHVKGAPAYVSRGGFKLERGLSAVSVDVSGKRCLDVGCSTGGFTDCLLSHGAAAVLAVDVGYAQFSWELRQDGRVELLERTNIVDVPTPERAHTIDLAVCDVSFTSVATVLPAVCELLAPEGTFLTLVKPQFEAAREQVGEGGIVESDEVRLAALEGVARAFCQAGLGLIGACESPITGRKGNVEYLLCGGLAAPSAELDLGAVVRAGAVVLAP